MTAPLPFSLAAEEVGLVVRIEEVPPDASS